MLLDFSQKSPKLAKAAIPEGHPTHQSQSNTMEATFYRNSSRLFARALLGVLWGCAYIRHRAESLSTSWNLDLACTTCCFPAVVFSEVPEVEIPHTAPSAKSLEFVTRFE